MIITNNGGFLNLNTNDTFTITASIEANGIEIKFYYPENSLGHHFIGIKIESDAPIKEAKNPRLVRKAAIAYIAKQIVNQNKEVDLYQHFNCECFYQEYLELLTLQGVN